MRSKLSPFLVIIIFFFITTYLYLLSFFLHSQSVVPAIPVYTAQNDKSTEKVTRVIDGDTFEIEGGIKIRLIGVDTPEMKNKNKTIDCFATEAKKKSEDLLTGKEVILEKDVSETDKYGRLLRYVYVGDQMINDVLVKEGYAKISTFPPDIKYVEMFKAGEKSARESNRGLWSACKL